MRIEPLERRRLFAAGHPDDTFYNRMFDSVPGRSQIDLAHLREVVDLDVSSIGQIVVTATTYFPRADLPEGEIDTGGLSVQFFRLHPDGSRDLHFGPNPDGSLTLPISPTVFGTDLNGATLGPHIHTHILPDDSLLVHVGNLIYRYGANGRPDRSFGTRGRMTARAFTAHEVQDVTMDMQGRVLVVGEVGAEFTIGRLATNGKPDLTFGLPDNIGLLRPVPGAVSRDMLAQTLPDGSMVLGGLAESTHDNDVPSDFEFALVKLKPDGTVDPSYGLNGLVREQHEQTDLITPSAHDPGVLADGSFFYTREQRDRDLFQSQFETHVYDATGSLRGETNSYNAISLAREGNLRVTITNHD